MLYLKLNKGELVLSGVSINLPISLLIILVFMLASLGCATTTQSGCPTIEEEPVSICRAREKCKLKKTNYGVGLGLSAQATENLGLIHERSLATKSYMDCVDKDLDEQRAKYQIEQDEKKVTDQ